jgi:hypothetical protein
MTAKCLCVLRVQTVDYISTHTPIKTFASSIRNAFEGDPGLMCVKAIGMVVKQAVRSIVVASRSPAEDVERWLNISEQQAPCRPWLAVCS